MAAACSRGMAALLVPLTVVALLVLGLVPGIPGFELIRAALAPSEAASGKASDPHHAIPQAEALTTDLVAAPATWSPGRNISRPATLLKTQFWPSVFSILALTVASGPKLLFPMLAVLLALALLPALGLRWARALRAPPVA